VLFIGHSVPDFAHQVAYPSDIMIDGTFDRSSPLDWVFPRLGFASASPPILIAGGIERIAAGLDAAVNELPGLDHYSSADFIGGVRFAALTFGVEAKEMLFDLQQQSQD